MDRYFDFIVRRRWLVLAGALAIFAAGLLNLRGFAIDAVPDISPKQVMVLTQANGLGPLEVERLVTFPIENAMAGLPLLKSVRSTTRAGLSAVYVTFEDNADANLARTQVSERMAQARETMPPNVGTPQLGPIATGLGEIYQFEVRGPGHTPMELRRLLQWTIAPRLKLVPGVADVNMYGGQMETFEVRIGGDALRRYNLSLKQVFQALTDNNQASGGAYLEHGDEQQVIRGLGLVTDPQDLAQIVLATGPDGTPVTVGSVGEVVRAPKVRLGAVTHDGEGETVVGVALMLYGENASQVIGGVKSAIADMGKQLPPGVEIRPYYDRSDLVARTIGTVEHNLIEGAILVVAVLLLLLGNLRAGLIVASAIPLSMLMAFAGMRALGISGNLMSLGAIDFGLIVDGAVVMVENAIRRRAAEPDEDAADVVRKSSADVAKPVLFSVAIILLVYVPILALGDVEGKMFRPMALTVILALASSLFLTMTVIPALTAAVLPNKIGGGDTRVVRWARAAYTPLLGRAEGHPGITILIAAVLFAGAVALGQTLGGEFIPRLSEGSIVVTSEKLPGISLDASLKTVTEIEKVLKSFPEVTRVVSLTGSAEIPTDPMGVESSDSFVTLKPKSEWDGPANQNELQDLIEKKLKEAVPGVAFTFSQPIQMREDDLLEGVKSDIAVQIYGDDLNTLHSLADQVTQAVKTVDGASDVKPEAQSGMPYLTVKVDRQRAARFGVNASDALAVVESLGGHMAGTVYGEDNSETDIVFRLPPADRTDAAHVASLPVANGQGRMVSLGDVADISVAPGPAQISREKLRRRIAVLVNLNGRDPKSFVADAQKAVADKVHPPPGYTMEWAGQYQSLESATSTLAVVVPIAMAAIFLLLYVNFDSLRLASLVFLNIPMAATGGIVGLVLRGMPFSVSAAIGFIATFGVAILNGVVLVSYIEAERAGGKPPQDAARDAAELRLRPVLMTAMVATLGFLPMAVSTGAGAEVQRPLATVVIGGLLTATLLTLVVLPSAYPAVIAMNMKRITRRFRSKQREPAE